METSVTIIDDTFRTNAVELKLGQMHLVKDNKGRQVQNVVQSEITFKGKALMQAITRAKRHMRSKRFSLGGGVPRHIAIYMAVFHKADPEYFQAYLPSK